MKTILTTHQQLPRTRRFSPRQATQPVANRHLQHTRAQGVALIIVLAIIVLVATLVIGFLTLATSERRASTTVAQNAETRLLAENAVDLVMGQIRAATTNLGNTKTWASQPGMIRVYGTTTGSAGLATLNSAYKLYSSGTMILTGSVNVAGEVPSSNWASAPGVYTDLNQPVTDSSGTMEYPIIDGNGLNISGSTTYSGTNSSNGLNAQAIQGFYINNAPTAAANGTTNPVPMPVQWLYQLKDGTIIAPDSNSGQGSAAVTFTTSGTAPSSKNPIVGRIAFWTDDETCKVNINTACEGTFWDTPYANNAMERGVSSPSSLTGTISNGPYGFASSYPVLDEFNRYPGHPATTSLSAVLGNWLPINAMDQWTNPQNYSTELRQYWALTPRIYNGGTASSVAPQGGTQGGFYSSCNTTIGQAINDSDRLYSTVDELYYQPALSGSSRIETNAALTPDVLEETKFFLTANSQAPEVTLFNTPRMSLWPIMTSGSFQTPQDQLLAFCASVGSGTAGTTRNPYYFQRVSNSTAGNYGSAYSPTQDLSTTTFAGLRNTTLYQYMQALTSNNIPGFGGNFTTKYGQNDQNQILTEMFDYVRSNVNLIPPYFTGTSSPPPGFSNYAYSLGDLSYLYGTPFYDSTYHAGSYCVIPLQPTSGAGAGTKGFGRMATITKADLVIWDYDNYNTATSGSNLQADGYSKPASTVEAFVIFQFFSPTTQNAPQTGGMRIRVRGLQQFAVNGNSLNLPSDATMVIAADAYWGEGGGDGLSQMPTEAMMCSDYSSGKRVIGTTSPGTSSELTVFPFCSSGSASLNGQTTMDFTGGPITISIYNPTNTAASSGGYGDLVQTISMTFPNANGWPAPKLPGSGVLPSYLGGANNPSPLGGTVDNGANTVFNDTSNPGGLDNRLTKIFSDYYNSGYNGKKFLFPSNTNTLGSSVQPQTNLGNATAGLAYGDARLIVEAPGDVTRDMEVNPSASFGGDYRLFCANATVPSGQFHECPNYYSTTIYNAATLHSDKFMSMGEYGYNDQKNTPTNQVLSGESWRPSSASTAGSLIKGIPYTPWAVPNTPVGLNGAFMDSGGTKPGDWETGVGLLPDGPLLRVPDTHVSNGGHYSYGSSTITGAAGIGLGDGGYYQLGWGFPSASSNINLTPNRQICSAVQFGALPTGAVAGTEPITPWQTLLFTAQPAGRTSPAISVPSGNEHYGFQSPPDYLFLDLFWMPVVQPYAISEPLSTAGKVNMNYQIMPFNYIHRETAIDAVMKNVLMTAIPPAAVQPRAAVASYKEWDATPYCFRYQINLNDQTGTLAGFEQRFTAGDIFHSASEICSISLVPQTITQLPSGMRYYNTSVTPSYSQMTSWWAGMTATGDNLRESPYNQIYPRLTTQSNSYRVHIRVQALRQTPGDANQGVWNEAKDQVVGEYRGSYLIERYVDPNDPNLPDFATNIEGKTTLPGGDSPSTSLDDYYRFRVLERKQFAP